MDEEGKMVDEAVVRRARQLIEGQRHDRARSK